jgi:hypothetical protein
MSATNASVTIAYVSGAPIGNMSRTLPVHMNAARMATLAKIRAGYQAGGVTFTNNENVIGYLLDVIGPSLT